MSFRMQGQRITLQGDPKLYRSLVSLKAMVQAMQVGGQGILVEYRSVELLEATVMEGVPTSIRAVLEKYEVVFQTPQGLPPQRNRDHVITLKGGTAPINVRPYRYPYVQKQEIEKLVGEMFATGIIRPSLSPFSSPIMLVKKRRGIDKPPIHYTYMRRGKGQGSRGLSPQHVDLEGGDVPKQPEKML